MKRRKGGSRLLAVSLLLPRLGAACRSGYVSATVTVGKSALECAGQGWIPGNCGTDARCPEQCPSGRAADSIETEADCEKECTLIRSGAGAPSVPAWCKAYYWGNGNCVWYVTKATGVLETICIVPTPSPTTPPVLRPTRPPTGYPTSYPSSPPTTVPSAAPLRHLEPAALELACGAAACAAYFEGIGGTHVVNLTSAPNYPDKPDSIEALSGPNGTSATFSTRNHIDHDDHGSNYGAILEGWFKAPFTGSYVFSSHGDDSSQVWAAAKQLQQSGLVLVIEDTACCHKLTGKLEHFMEAGGLYYIRGLMKEGVGKDYFDVGATCVHGADPGCAGTEYFPVPIGMFEHPNGGTCETPPSTLPCGGFSYDPNTFVYTGDGSEYAHWPFGEPVADFVFEANIRSSDPHPGVIFRADAPNSYLVVLFGPQSAELWQSKGGACAERTELAKRPPWSMPNGEWFRVKVEGRGSSFTISCDGELLFDNQTVPGAPTAGQVGFFSGFGSKAEFALARLWTDVAGWTAEPQCSPLGPTGLPSSEPTSAPSAGPVPVGEPTQAPSAVPSVSPLSASEPTQSPAVLPTYSPYSPPTLAPAAECTKKATLANAMFSTGDWDSSHAAANCIDGDRGSQTVRRSVCASGPPPNAWPNGNPPSDVFFRAELTDYDGNTVCRVDITPRQDHGWERLGTHEIWIGNDPSTPDAGNNTLCSTKTSYQRDAVVVHTVSNIIGRYVFLLRPGPVNMSLNFNEIEVYYSVPNTTASPAAAQPVTEPPSSPATWAPLAAAGGEFVLMMCSDEACATCTKEVRQLGVCGYMTLGGPGSMKGFHCNQSMISLQACDVDTNCACPSPQVVTIAVGQCFNCSMGHCMLLCNEAPAEPPSVAPSAPPVAPSTTPASLPAGAPTLPPQAGGAAPSATPSIPPAPAGAPTATPAGEPNITASPAAPSVAPSATPAFLPAHDPTLPPQAGGAAPSATPSVPPAPPAGAPTPAPAANATPPVPPSAAPGPVGLPTLPPQAGGAAPSAAPSIPPAPPAGAPTPAPAANATPPTPPSAAPGSGGGSPSGAPSAAPHAGAALPSGAPSATPSVVPTVHPASPSTSPSLPPTKHPLPPGAPSTSPAVSPPTVPPSAAPTEAPSGPTAPSTRPSAAPSLAPAAAGSGPSAAPSQPPGAGAAPTVAPAATATAPSTAPSAPAPPQPSAAPSAGPSAAPLPPGSPTNGPVAEPTQAPAAPSTAPTQAPASGAAPSEVPSAAPAPGGTPTAPPAAPGAAPSLPPSAGGPCSAGDACAGCAGSGCSLVQGLGCLRKTPTGFAHCGEHSSEPSAAPSAGLPPPDDETPLDSPPRPPGPASCAQHQCPSGALVAGAALLICPGYTQAGCTDARCCADMQAAAPNSSSPAPLIAGVAGGLALLALCAFLLLRKRGRGDGRSQVSGKKLYARQDLEGLAEMEDRQDEMTYSLFPPVAAASPTTAKKDPPAAAGTILAPPVDAPVAASPGGSRRKSSAAGSQRKGSGAGSPRPKKTGSGRKAGRDSLRGSKGRGEGKAALLDLGLSVSSTGAADDDVPLDSGDHPAESVASPTSPADATAGAAAAEVSPRKKKKKDKEKKPERPKSPASPDTGDSPKRSKKKKSISFPAASDDAAAAAAAGDSRRARKASGADGSEGPEPFPRAGSQRSAGRSDFGSRADSLRSAGSGKAPAAPPPDPDYDPEEYPDEPAD